MSNLLSKGMRSNAKASGARAKARRKKKGFLGGRGGAVTVPTRLRGLEVAHRRGQLKKQGRLRGN